MKRGALTFASIAATTFAVFAQTDTSDWLLDKHSLMIDWLSPSGKAAVGAKSKSQRVGDDPALAIALPPRNASAVAADYGGGLGLVDTALVPLAEAKLAFADDPVTAEPTKVLVASLQESLPSEAEREMRQMLLDARREKFAADHPRLVALYASDADPGLERQTLNVTAGAAEASIVRAFMASLLSFSRTDGKTLRVTTVALAERRAGVGASLSRVAGDRAQTARTIGRVENTGARATTPDTSKALSSALAKQGPAGVLQDTGTARRPDATRTTGMAQTERQRLDQIQRSQQAQSIVRRQQPSATSQAQPALPNPNALLSIMGAGGGLPMWTGMGR